MCRRLMVTALVSALCLTSTAWAQDVVWDFENGNDHGFTLWSVKPATPAPDDPNTAGDEALTGVGGDNGLPAAGLAWTIGLPTQFDGLKPAVAAKARVDPNGLLKYSLGTLRMPVDAGTLNTYNLNMHGDGIHTQSNDQIATSPVLLLYEGAVLTVRSMGGGGAHPPVLDPNAALGYTDGSNGIAVFSAADGALLATLHTNNKGTLKESVLDLSALAGQKVYIEVVDAFEGSWGWLAVDEIRITNARVLRAAAMIVAKVDLSAGFDQAMHDRLAAMGYDVAVVPASDVKGGVFTVADADAYDLLLVSESIGSKDADKLIGTTTPVMHNESYGWDNWFLTTPTKIMWAPAGTSVDIVTDAHPITALAGVPVGPMAFYRTEAPWTTELASAMAPGAELIAKITVDGNDYAIVFAIEKGAELANGGAAPARAVGFSIPADKPYDAGVMTDEAWAFWTAAVRWLDPRTP